MSRPFTYFTLLRDPVDRVISEYFYILNKQDHPLFADVAKKEVDLENFVKHWNAPNLQTKKISGITFADNSGINMRKKISTVNMLAVAKENLSNHFAVVGLAERFDETLILLKREFGWDWPFYIKDNVTRGKIARQEIPDSTLAVIREHNRLDAELYEYAKKRFNEQVESQGLSFYDEVEKFRKLNKIIGDKIYRKKNKSSKFLSLKRKVKGFLRF